MRIRLIIIILLSLSLCSALYLFIFRRSSTPAPDTLERCEFTISELTVNLADARHRRYLRTSLLFIIEGENTPVILEERSAEIYDTVIFTLTQHTYDDLLTASGKEQLKHDLILAAEEVLAEHQLAVKDVLFLSFLMD